MEIIPTLFDLAMDVVADGYEVGLLPSHHVRVISTVQEKIFDNVMKARNCYDAHTKTLIETFQPTKLELILNFVKEFSSEEVRKLKLTHLRLCWPELITKYRMKGPQPEFSEQMRMLDGSLDTFFDIAYFLEDILSAESKEGLRVLDLSGVYTFGPDWIEEISSMFPNLEVLNISHRKISERDFTILCNNLPNLRSLDIGSTGLRNLNGISKIQNLENLAINSLGFETKEDIQEMFELKKLKKLSFSGISNSNWNYRWFFEHSFPELTCVDCQWPNADNHFLSTILSNQPKLKTIVASGTRITQEAATPGITIYTKENEEATLKTMKYFRTQGKLYRLLDVFCDFRYFFHRRELGEVRPEELTSYVYELESAIRAFKLDKKRFEASTEDFLRFLSSILIKNTENVYLNTDKLKVIDILLMELTNHLKARTGPYSSQYLETWSEIGKIMEITKYVNIDRVCALAMESIIYATNPTRINFPYDTICATLLETSMDQMDLFSKYYKKINLSELHECLSKIRDRDALLPEERESVENVLRFVELFL